MLLKIGAPFFNPTRYLEKYLTEFNIVFNNGLAENWKKFLCIMYLRTIS